MREAERVLVSSRGSDLNQRRRIGPYGTEIGGGMCSITIWRESLWDKAKTLDQESGNLFAALVLPLNNICYLVNYVMFFVLSFIIFIKGM